MDSESISEDHSRQRQEVIDGLGKTQLPETGCTPSNGMSLMLQKGVSGSYLKPRSADLRNGPTTEEGHRRGRHPYPASLTRSRQTCQRERAEKFGPEVMTIC